MLEYLPPEEGKLRLRKEHPSGYWLIREEAVYCHSSIHQSFFCHAPVPLLAIDHWGTWALGNDGRSYLFALPSSQGEEQPWSQYYE
jgi:hypothetical protein